LIPWFGEIHWLIILDIVGNIQFRWTTVTFLECQQWWYVKDGSVGLVCVGFSIYPAVIVFPDSNLAILSRNRKGMQEKEEERKKATYVSGELKQGYK
jgi:hypothetical protein